MNNPLSLDNRIVSEIINCSQDFFTKYTSIDSSNIKILEKELFSIKNDEINNELIEKFNQYGFCVIRNMPIDDISNKPTPKDNNNQLTTSKTSCATLVWLYQILGMGPVGIEGVRNGALFHDIVPTINLDGHAEVNDAAWARPLGFHQEMAFLNAPTYPTIPTALALLCLRAGEGKRPATLLAHVDDVLSCLDPEEISILKEPIFIISAPHFIPWVPTAQPLLFTSLDGEKMSLTYSALYTGSNKTIVVAKDACLEAGIEYKKALSVLEALDRSYQILQPYSLTFGARDCAVIDNRIVQHGRSAFEGNSQNRLAARWLLRAYGMPYEYLPPDRYINIKAHNHAVAI